MFLCTYSTYTGSTSNVYAHFIIPLYLYSSNNMLAKQIKKKKIANMQLYNTA